jgi:hypothetical protein
VNWTSLSVAFFVSHVVGDFIFQTDFQALNKRGGLGRDPVARRALFGHALTYGLTFVPALVWIANNRGAGTAVGIGALIIFPHVLVDDGRLLRVWVREVKRAPDPPAQLLLMVDQAFHLAALFGAAILAAS